MDQDTFGKVTKHNNYDSQEVSPFPAGDQKLLITTIFVGSLYKITHDTYMNADHNRPFSGALY